MVGESETHKNAHRQSFTRTLPQVGPATIPCTGWPKASMTSPRCPCHICFRSLGLAAWVTVSYALLPCPTAFSLLISEPYLTCLPGAEPRTLVPRDCIVFDPCQPEMGLCERSIHMRKDSWTSCQLPGCRVSLILRTGLELPLPSWPIWHPTGSPWDPGTSTVMSQGHPTLHPTQGHRTVTSDTQMTPPLWQKAKN